MRGHPNIYLLAVALAAASFGASADAQEKAAQTFNPPCPLSAPEISKEIRTKGVPKMMHGLLGAGSDYTGAIDLRNCIWGGKKEWLDIAVPVVTEMRQDSEDWIPDAVQNALVVNPEVVLSEHWPVYFTIQDYICSVSVDDYDHYGDAISELNRRVAAVKQMHRPDLKGKVDECLMGFEKAKGQLAKFFQIEKPSDYVSPQPGTAPPPLYHSEGIQE
ncbi:MAG TPA: hypothetical protein VGH91_07055 [Gammaproteobacteria bacterium]|jgi:hypothetical protein